MSKMQIPESWAKAKLESVASKITDGSHNPPKAQSSGLPMLSCRNIKDGQLIFDEFRYIAKAEFEIEHRRTQVSEGDVLLSIVGTIGSTAVVKKEYLPVTLQRSVAVITLSNGVLPHFFRFFLNSPNGVKFLESNSAGSTQKGIYLKSLRSMPLPIPPHGEQKRIVAKIESTQEKIKTIESSISKAEDLIEKYRESLLQKAFRGELVPQDPNDEPASKLIERIRNERAKQSDGKKKKKDELPPIKPDEIPFEIPKSWEWVRLGAIVTVSSGDGLTTANQKVGSIPVFGGNGIAGYHDQANLNSQTIVIGRVGAKCGVVHITPKKSWVTDNALIVTPFADLDQNWLATALSWLNLNADANRSAQPVISGLKIYPRLIPLPPLAEQTRIVNAIDAQVQTIGSLVSGIASVRSCCAQALSSILNHGFSGRLVAQDPLEGTGHELLQRIAQASNELVEDDVSKGPAKKRVPRK